MTAMKRDPEDVKDFLAESKAYLEEVEPRLVRVRGNPAGLGGDGIAGLFRAFHSVKGVAGFLGFEQVKRLTHRTEEMLDKLRSGKSEWRMEMGEALLGSCDLLRTQLSAIETQGEDLSTAEAVDSQCGLLEAFLPDAKISAAAKAATNAPAAGGHPFWGHEGFRQGLIEAGKGALDNCEAALVSLLDKPGDPAPWKDCAREVQTLEMPLSLADSGGLPPLIVSVRQLAEELGQAGKFNADALNLLFTALRQVRDGLEAMPLDNDAANQVAATTKECQDLLETLRNQARIVDAVTKPIPTNKPETVPAKADQQPARQEGGASASDSQKSGAEVRVGVDKLDRMISLIEEMGVVSAYLAAGTDPDDFDELAFHLAAGKLRQVSEELQEVAMAVRLVPLSMLFRKMVRLVSDVSAKLGKKTQLEISGEQTEVDRDLLDAMADPLVHILRNCLDHGLEMPDERTAAGKPETGKVHLEAWHAGGEVCISISDDGRGLNRDRLIAKAVANGLIKGDGSQMTDSEVHELIFHPGFSLAKSVTEFSGRGVGMDVVRKNVESLRGRVEILSEFGKGTSFLIHLPLANSLTECLLMRTGGLRYVVRVSSVRETFRPAEKDIVKTPDGMERVSCRDGLHPLLRLHRLHGLHAASPRVSDGLVVLVENRGEQLGILVDEVLGKIQAVVKTQPSYLKQAHSLGGHAILGTRSDDVAWSLNLNALIGAGAHSS